MLRILKILLVISVAMWGLLGILGNIIDWSGTIGAVEAATSMSTFEGGSENWRATSNPVLIYAGVFFILLMKTAVTLLCSVGAWQMWMARTADNRAFALAKTYALAGCAAAMLMLFAGWIVIAETWFELWRSDIMRDPVLGSAFRYGAMIALIALLVGANDD